MRLAVDLRPLLLPFESGVTVYTKAMVRALMRCPDVELDLYYQAANRYDSIHKLFPRVRHIRRSNRAFHLKSLFKFPRLPEDFFSERPDLIWIPDRRPFYRTDIPVVMTIHDRVPERFASTLSLKSRLWHQMFPLKRLSKLSKGFLVPSESIASELKVKIPVEVTYEGAELDMAEQAPRFAEFLNRKIFFLMIAPNDKRKCFEWLFKLAEELPAVSFVWVGSKEGDTRFSGGSHKAFPHVFQIPEVNEREKKWLLSRARALLAFSQYEGFDLPVLEATEASCPVLLSDIPVHRELYESTWPFIRNYEEAKELVEQALHHSIPLLTKKRKLSWKEAAERALLFFHRVIVHKDR